MKSLFVKSAIVGLLSIIAMSSVFADVQCKVHNARGESWVVTDFDRPSAERRAMRHCAKYSANCLLSWCRPVGILPPPPPVVQWHCNAGNARGQEFVGTGPTHDIAYNNVMAYCGAHSFNPQNCRFQGCSRN